MKKRKNNTNKNYFSFFILITLLLLISFQIFNHYSDFKYNQNHDKLIDNYFEETYQEIKENDSKSESQQNYITFYGIIEIPVINLQTGFFEFNHKNNNVNKYVQVINQDLPSTKNGNFILASHSGNSSVSHFKNIYKLNINDTILIYFKNKSYEYKIVNKYNQEKNGTIIINRDLNKSSLTLTTCDPFDSTKQIIIIAELELVN